ncbi:hypothetical protein KQI89_17220 [Clostridium sp. MSJ-4]|uniref:Uncharacterized protein n=1 Tax=Clostridium simiarum TaxID=2841506 RepID=A0ABS6F7G6_9CLOT|nr:hypothetical protein [Clostridium simiarum]MBU5593482.1 hypothetical protein [Clostridium simiarum]
MDEKVLIIPTKRKDLRIISRKSLTIGVGIGIAIAATIGATFFLKHSPKGA